MSSLYSTCCVLFLALAIVALHVSPAVSTSRRVFVGWHEPELGFRVMLKHIDSAADGSVGVKAPVVAGNGEYLMYLSIGTPPKSYSAIMDTASDLIWIQCKPCSQCVMSTEILTFGKVLVPKIGFGCGEENEAEGFSKGAGLVGLGRGALSLVSQLKEPKFSYCLVPFDDTHKSTLLMGSIARVNRTFGAVKTTPMIHNPLQPSFYYLQLNGISVGKTHPPIEKSSFALRADGTGGLIINSGTTITYLEGNAFHAVKKRFIKKMKLPLDNLGGTGLDLCLTLPSGVTEVKVPKLVFHFEGADLDLPAENYMISDTESALICLAMGRSNDISIFGNIQQQNTMVLHDLKQNTVSFAQTQCHKL
ncbi:hypothetical protein F3Y22_tig00110788pilonHSYRG00458 [Hibiscus syriacus]|uniref:Peptidase A1 domain-containing protein n=1 Tax=Hibiscus syriacus TaxID=106335 RepID=A0A6A2ZSH9_HIBSY|nr:hypothetical protein F3Y22_tig00110788pilonHSYRG00458 [Hibiscus syriacus]